MSIQGRVGSRLTLLRCYFVTFRFESAGDLYRNIELFREAVQAYVDGRAWNKARQCCDQDAPKVRGPWIQLCTSVYYCGLLCVLLWTIVDYCVLLCTSVYYCVLLCAIVYYCVPLSPIVSHCLPLSPIVSHCIPFEHSLTFRCFSVSLFLCLSPRCLCPPVAGHGGRSVPEPHVVRRGRFGFGVGGEHHARVGHLRPERAVGRTVRRVRQERAGTGAEVRAVFIVPVDSTCCW